MKIMLIHNEESVKQMKSAVCVRTFYTATACPIREKDVDLQARHAFIELTKISFIHSALHKYLSPAIPFVKYDIMFVMHCAF